MAERKLHGPGFGPYLYDDGEDMDDWDSDFTGVKWHASTSDGKHYCANATFTDLTASRLVGSDGDKYLSSEDLVDWITGVEYETIVTDNGDGSVTIELDYPKIATKTGNYSVLEEDTTILVNAAGGVVTLSLPTAVGIAGKVFNFKKIDSSANVVSISASGAELIDGAGSMNLTVQYEAVILRGDGANWWIF